MHDIIFFPKISLDLQHLFCLANNSFAYDIEKKHHRMVKDDEYMLGLSKKYWFLDSVYNVYKIYSLPLHIDAGRKCALNIPLLNTDQSETIVYDKIIGNTTLNKSRVLYELEKNNHIVELFRFTLNKPTLFNTTYPHEVICSDYERISISWSVKPEYSFEQAKHFFQDIDG